MSDKSVRMAYVAEDPEQPGAAWAVCMDDPDSKKQTAKKIAEYIQAGAIVHRVDRDTAVAMLGRWKRKE